MTEPYESTKQATASVTPKTRKTDLPEMPASCPSGIPSGHEFLELRRRFEEHLIEQRAKHRLYDEKHTSTLEALAKLTVAITTLTESTSSIVEAWKTVNNLQKFFVWVSGFSVLIAMAAYVFSKLPTPS